LYETSVLSTRNTPIRLANLEDADVKILRIQTGNNLAGIAHLRIGQAGVSQAVNEDANRLHRKLTAPKLRV
jgi:hypothetical protein